MGQYHLIINIDKREYIDPHALDVGLKAWEQLVSFPSTPQALFVLLLASNGRGGGHLKSDPIIGCWAGDRIAVIGDYVEYVDFEARPGEPSPREIYDLCRQGAYRDVSGEVLPVLTREIPEGE